MCALMLAGILCLNACTRENFKTTTCLEMPPFPVAGKLVAKELETLENAPHTWEWLARLYQLKQVLELKNPPKK